MSWYKKKSTDSVEQLYFKTEYTLPEQIKKECHRSERWLHTIFRTGATDSLSGDIVIKRLEEIWNLAKCLLNVQEERNRQLIWENDRKAEARLKNVTANLHETEQTLARLQKNLEEVLYES